MTERAAIESDLAWLPDYLQFRCDYVPFIGAQVALRYEGDLLFSGAVGDADTANGVKLRTDHVFRVASHSKTFTGVAVMQLVEAGMLRLDDVVSMHVPELAADAMSSVTVRELLGHGSGMIRDGDDCSYWSLERPFPDEQELLTTIREHGKVIEPNEHYKYSNVGYSLLGMIVERASGTPYREYVAANIVDRLDPSSTGPDLDGAVAGRLAKGYSSRAHGPKRVEIEHIDTAAESAATGFYSTAEELCAYFDAHLDGDDRLVSDASKRRMRQVQWTITEEAMYGLGLSITKVNGRTYYGHGGAYPGHITMSRFDPDRRLVLSVLTNTNDGPAGVLSTAILHLIDLALDAGHTATTGPHDLDELSKFTGRFADLWGVVDVVELGGRLYLLSPTLENPAAEAIELEMHSDTELKVVGDRGTGGYGEKMRYTFSPDGSVEWVRGASGHRLVPASAYSLPEVVRRPSQSRGKATE